MERQLKELRDGRSIEVSIYDKRRNERGRDPNSGILFARPLHLVISLADYSFLLYLNFLPQKVRFILSCILSAVSTALRDPRRRSGVRRDRSRQPHLLRGAHSRPLRHEALR